MSHTCRVTSTTHILRPGIRTFKPRRSRITPRQRRALTTPGPPSASVDEIGVAWTSGHPVVLDIGFGSAEQVLDLANTFPEEVIVAIDVHLPGIGDLIDRCRAQSVPNVYVVEADALEVLPKLPSHVAGVRSFFPDPWPKVRHHKRRLVQPAVIDAVHAALEPGGSWHIATDWAEYAEFIREAFDADGRWTGGVITRPSWRPITHFERRAHRDGRDVVDMWFTRK